MNFGRRNKGKTPAFEASKSLGRDGGMGSKEDNLILCVVGIESDFEEEIQLLGWRLEDMPSSTRRSGSGSASNTREGEDHPHLKAHKDYNLFPLKSSSVKGRLKEKFFLIHHSDGFEVPTQWGLGMLHLRHPQDLTVVEEGQVKIMKQHDLNPPPPLPLLDENISLPPVELLVVFELAALARPSTQKSIEPRRKGNSQHTKEEPYSYVSKKGLELQIAVQRKYRKDASVSSDEVARTFAAQCILPSDLEDLRAEKAEVEKLEGDVQTQALEHNRFVKELEECFRRNPTSDDPKTSFYLLLLFWKKGDKNLFGYGADKSDL
ncbi:hypothetical protein JCGZ_19987 [Jatropha curcas]|uniref:Uncharacterized protein n=1 Tax=Jatropha curcas TaxID=180498 RepID=A0A067K689_JATCU|nr:hypothetical protein JCGZ_19987 [Jatropha curcas]